MTAVLFQPPGLSSPVSRQPTAPAAPRLRDSCEACAKSKLKCCKAKPTCSRCAKRGVICEYVAIKRGKRAHDTQSSNENGGGHTFCEATAADTVAAARPSSPLGSWFMSDPTMQSTEPLLSPGNSRPSPKATTSGASPDLFPNIRSPVDQSSFFTATDVNSLDNAVASPQPYLVLGPSDSDSLGQSDLFSTGVAGISNGPASLFDAFTMFEDAVSDGFTFSTPRSLPESSAMTSNEISSFQGLFAVDHNCFCLARALSLMKQLFPNPSTPCTSLARQGPDKNISAPTLQSVIAKNEHTLGSIKEMLQCSCSQDGYLLTIISLIVFKVLGWYAAAARKTPCSDDDHSVESSHKSHSRSPSHSEQVLQDPVVVGSYSIEGKDSERMAMQLVLSELHHVQRLLNQLSTKLKVQAARDGEGTDMPNGMSSGVKGCETSLRLSAVMVDQFELELRKRLRALSSEIVQRLRGA